MKTCQVHLNNFPLPGTVVHLTGLEYAKQLYDSAF
jgi:hypothetical protein